MRCSLLRGFTVLKKGVNTLIKKSQVIFFARYEEARAKLDTVYRVSGLTAYSDNSLYLFEQNYWEKICHPIKYNQRH